MQPLQYDLQCPAAKDNSNYSITHAAAAPSNLDAAITMRAAKTKLQSTVELRATASEIAAPKPDGSRRQREKITIWKRNSKRKIATPTQKSLYIGLSPQPWCSHIHDSQLQKTIVLLRKQPQTLMQPLQCVLQHHEEPACLDTHGNRT